MDQQFDNNLLDLIKQKGFYPYEYINNFEKLKEKLPRKETFYIVRKQVKRLVTEYQHVLMFWNKFEMKTTKDYHNLHFKCDVLL